MQAAKAALAELIRERAVRKQPFAVLLLAPFWPIPRTAWALGLASLLLAAVIPWRPDQERQTRVPLIAFRGGNSALLASASVHDKVTFKVDATKIAAFPVYKLQLVNSNGDEVWMISVTAQKNEVVALVPHRLSTGHY